MGRIERAVDRAVDAAARLVTAGRRSGRPAFHEVRRAWAERRAVWVARWREIRRPYSEIRDARDMEHLAVMLGFWLAEDSNCVDIGANRGTVLRMLQERAPRGTHHAFEPIPHLAGRLRASFPDVTVHELALDAVAGPVEFTVVDRDGYSGIRQHLRELPREWETHTIVVQAARLDDVLPPDYVPRFVKIDVEGAEIGVLRGAREVLRRSRPILFMEHGAGEGTAEIHELLTGLGYAIHNVDGDGPFADVEAMIAGAKGRDGWLWNWVCV